MTIFETIKINNIMKTKLLKIIRANFWIKYCKKFDQFDCWDRSFWIQDVHSHRAFDAIVRMLEQIYPQGKHYAIMRHSRRFKQARREDSVMVIEVACVVGFAALVIITILNSCC